MAAVVKQIILTYRKILDIRDPRTENWFLVGSIWPIFAILVSYWMFVNKWGPNFMKNRAPFNLDRIIQVYNALQVVVSAYLFYQGWDKAYGPWGKYSWACEPVDFSNAPAAMSVAGSVHAYFLVKVVDLMDTVFFVLRKKQSQVTFLHVYHHMGMVAFAWVGAVFLPGGHGVLLGTINCFVHTVMYGYYFVTIWNPEYKKNIWWKKHITQLQILQFIILFFHNSSLLVHPGCGYPAWSAMLLMPQCFFFTILFMDFYRKAYMRKQK